MAQELISTAQIAAALNVNRFRVHQLRQTYADDFPEPVIQRTRSTYYSAAQMRRWATKHGKQWNERAMRAAGT